jgi:tetratricopeptide (TPR) repeat protein
MNRILPLVAFLIIFALNAPGLDNGFHYDDEHSLLDNPHIRDLGNVPSFFVSPQAFSVDPQFAMYRPLVLVSYALNYASGAYNPFYYQLFNLLVHSLTVVLVFLLLRAWTLSATAAFFAALLFGLHPLQSEVVHYISSRSESMASFFYLSALLGYIYARKEETSSIWGSLSLLAFGAALLCKATAVTLPLSLALVDWPLKQRASSLRYWSKKNLPYWILSGGYIIAYYTLVPGGLDRASQVRPALIQFATQIKALPYYAYKAIFPVSPNVFPQFFTAPSLLHAPSLWAFFAVISLGALCLRSQRRHALPILFFVITLIPTLIVPLHILVNDHRLYLPLFALALWGGQIFPFHAVNARYTRYTRYIAMAICVCFALLSAQRTPIWHDELSLWADAAKKSPLMPEAQYNWGYALHLNGNLESARSAYEKAIALNPHYARALNNLGAIYKREGKLEKARNAFETALVSEPENAETLNNIGLCHAALGQHDQALWFYKHSLQLEPDRAEIWLNMGLSLRDLGEIQEAGTALRRALTLDPNIKQLIQRPTAP